jgi:phosphoglycolate phosphatase-like HAD superfamily hydrolase
MSASQNDDRRLVPGVLIDLDGTLVDSVYQHVVAWHEAFREHGHDVPQARIHAGIGMGGDRLVPWLLGRHVDHAGELSDDHKRRFLDRTETLRPTTGARELLDDLERREVDFVIATSASGEEREALLGVLGRQDLPVTDSEGVDSSKPSPELLQVSCAHAGFLPERSLMVGDAPWDAVAARAIAMEAVGVRCGGFSDTVLRQAGARRIADDPAGLIGQL